MRRFAALPHPNARALLLGFAAVAVAAVLVWQGVTADGAPDPATPNLSHGAVIVNSGILVFREGLEAILVLAAVTAGLNRTSSNHWRPIAAGSGVAFLAALATWFIVVAIISAINAPALDVQAATGLLAIGVLLIIMNWFFHRIYWTGWIAHHNRRKREIIKGMASDRKAATLLGLALLGFSAVYREGFEIVLFLQSLRMQSDSRTVLGGVLIGLSLTAVVAALTFVAHQHLPYKRMLVVTGVLLAVVLVVMVGESVQEMQLAGWISTTTLPLPIPDWAGVWFALFPNVEGLSAQLLAACLVLGSYVAARWRVLNMRPAQSEQPLPARAEG